MRFALQKQISCNQNIELFQETRNILMIVPVLVNIKKSTFNFNDGYNHNFTQLQCQMAGHNTKEKPQESLYLNIFVWKLLIVITKNALSAFLKETEEDELTISVLKNLSPC